MAEPFNIEQFRQQMKGEAPQNPLEMQGQQQQPIPQPIPQPVMANPAIRQPYQQQHMQPPQQIMPQVQQAQPQPPQYMPPQVQQAQPQPPQQMMPQMQQVQPQSPQQMMPQMQQAQPQSPQQMPPQMQQVQPQQPQQMPTLQGQPQAWLPQGQQMAQQPQMPMQHLPLPPVFTAPPNAIPAQNVEDVSKVSKLKLKRHSKIKMPTSKIKLPKIKKEKAEKAEQVEENYTTNTSPAIIFMFGMAAGMALFLVGNMLMANLLSGKSTPSFQDIARQNATAQQPVLPSSSTETKTVTEVAAP